MKRILIDLDGCLAAMIEGFADHHGVSREWQAPGHYSFKNGFGISQEDWWKGINKEFWENLEKTKEADLLIHSLTELRKFKIGMITAIPMGPYGYPQDRVDEYILGKLHWMHKYYPQFVECVLWGSAKYFCASPDSILIDDSDENIELFNEHGGSGILFPRPWNRLHRLSYFKPRNMVNYLLNEIIRYSKEE